MYTSSGCSLYKIWVSILLASKIPLFFFFKHRARVHGQDDEGIVIRYEDLVLAGWLRRGLGAFSIVPPSSPAYGRNGLRLHRSTIHLS